MQLANKCALITGGSQGLGRAIAQRLAGAGMDIALHYKGSPEQAQQTAQQVRQLSPKSLAVQADLCQPQQIQIMLDKLRIELGPIDALVNNAAIFVPTPLEEFDPAVWKQIFEVNVFGPAALSQSLGKQMKLRGAGKIINILDVAAQRPFASHAGYCASKAALASLTKSWAKALAPQVQVNAVAPGIIDWPDFFSDAQRRTYLQQTPLGRLAAYDDVAGTVLFLLKEAPFITGQIINVDGGRTL